MSGSQTVLFRDVPMFGEGAFQGTIAAARPPPPQCIPPATVCLTSLQSDSKKELASLVLLRLAPLCWQGCLACGSAFLHPSWGLACSHLLPSLLISFLSLGPLTASYLLPSAGVLPTLSSHFTLMPSRLHKKDVLRG